MNVLKGFSEMQSLRQSLLGERCGCAPVGWGSVLRTGQGEVGLTKHSAGAVEQTQISRVSHLEARDKDLYLVAPFLDIVGPLSGMDCDLKQGDSLAESHPWKGTARRVFGE